MVLLSFLSKAAATACLFANFALAQQPLTVDDVKNVHSDLTAQIQQINATAKTISPGSSFIEYGWFGSGPVKTFLDLLANIDPLLRSAAASLDESVTEPIGSSTITDDQDSPKEIYFLHSALLKQVRDEFRTIKRQSTGISCNLLGIIPLSSCKAKAGEVRQALLEHKDALSDFRYGVQDYDYLYGVAIQDNWFATLGEIDKALKMYDEFAPPDPEPEPEP